MDRNQASKLIGKTISQAIESGTHQLDLVAILEAHKHSLLQQSFEANKAKPSKLFPEPTLLEGGN